MKRKKIAISLIWIKKGQVGGVESFTRNLLYGLYHSDRNNEYILLCSIDNYKSFKSLEKNDQISVLICPIKSTNIIHTILYESFCLDRLISKLKVDLCFIPCYRMPLFWSKNKYIVVIHDLISYHYPKYFSFIRGCWLNFGYKRAAIKSHKCIAISDFVANDIYTKFKIKTSKISTIYNPVLPTITFEDFGIISAEYKINAKQYLYTVSSLQPHKNLITIINALNLIKSNTKINHLKLVISGVGKVYDSPLYNYVQENNLTEQCIFTGFISNERRNSLIKNAALFLFPSVFEGFGMPPVEAIIIGTKVITTKCTAIPEVTKGLAIYVDNPYDIKEWSRKIEENFNIEACPHYFKEYDPISIANSYINIFNNE